MAHAGRAEEGHQFVADELVQGPVVLEDDLYLLGQDLVEHRHHLFRLLFLGIGGEPPDIGEKDGDIFPLASQLKPGGVFHQLRDHFFGKIVAEGLFDPKLLLFFGKEAVAGDGSEAEYHDEERADQVDPEAEMDK